MAANDVLLKVSDVCLRLGGQQILEKVTFEVRDLVRPGTCTGQVVALLGPSGVGKTRLLRLIAGLDAPDAGSITVTAGAPVVTGTVGVVFQDYPLLRHRTVEDNLVTAGVANGMSGEQARARAATLLTRFGLGNRGRHFPLQISGGQRQRVAIAQQLMKQKTLLLMDEPFSGLDPAALDEVVKLLIEVANLDELNTIVIVTHDIRSAMIVSDHVLMLGRDRASDGRVASGAKIQTSHDLVAAGLAWRQGVEQDPKFIDLEREIKQAFKSL